jgi:hypothetical protein
LHEIGNWFDLAHHSQGSSGKNRRALLYPRTLFLAKQESERIRLENERYKIIDKFKNKDSYSGEPPKNPKTFREQVIRELWEEKYGVSGERKEYVTTNMLKCLD